MKMAEFLLSHKPDVVLDKESLSGKGPGYAFAEAEVKTVQTESRSLDALAEQLVVALSQR
jgi:hypothetical protein